MRPAGVALLETLGPAFQARARALGIELTIPFVVRLEFHGEPGVDGTTLQDETTGRWSLVLKVAQNYQPATLRHVMAHELGHVLLAHVLDELAMRVTSGEYLAERLGLEIAPLTTWKVGDVASDQMLWRVASSDLSSLIPAVQAVAAEQPDAKRWTLPVPHLALMFQATVWICKGEAYNLAFEHGTGMIPSRPALPTPLVAAIAAAMEPIASEALPAGAKREVIVDYATRVAASVSESFDELEGALHFLIRDNAVELLALSA